MLDYKYRDLYWTPHVDKQLTITAEDGSVTFTNEDIHFEEFELQESICSVDELQFGACEASSLKFKISNVFIPLKDKWLNVQETLDGNTDEPFRFGKYKVFSDVPTADRRYRTVTAYDSMYDIINADVAAWYNSILPTKDSKTTMKEFRSSFAQYFGIAEEERQLVNDEMRIEKTIEPQELSGKDVLSAICEINGCFGHISRNGKLDYIYLQQEIQGIYPADFLYPDHVPEQWDYLSQSKTGHLYPQDPKSIQIGTGTYISCQYEDFIVRGIDRIQIRKEEGDIGTVYGSGENTYIIEGNFLVYGKGNDELNDIAGNLYGKITGLIYRPFKCEAVGNPCLEVGDPVRLSTKYELVESYILTRTLKGIQAPRDSYTSDGEEQRSSKLNSTAKSIMELKGKTNVLERNVEENRVTIGDVEQGLTSQIVQNADRITQEIIRATEAEGTLSTQITQTDTEIRAEVENTKEDLQSQITQNAGEIALRVTKSGLISEINASPEQIVLRSNRLVVQSTNFSLDGNGNATYSGTVSGSVITGSTISGGSITCGNVDFTGTLRAGGGSNSVVINSDGIAVGNKTAVTQNSVYTDGTVMGTYGTFSTINGYSYPPPSSAVVATTGTGIHGVYVNLGGQSIPTGDWVTHYCTSWFAFQSTVNNLTSRVAALEAKG